MLVEWICYNFREALLLRLYSRDYKLSDFEAQIISNWDAFWNARKHSQCNTNTSNFEFLPLEL